MLVNFSGNPLVYHQAKKKITQNNLRNIRKTEMKQKLFYFLIRKEKQKTKKMRLNFRGKAAKDHI